MLTLPEGTLPLRENQLVARKVKAGWQLCRVKRFVWQDALVILQSEGKVFGLIRETDTLDSKSPSENNGLFVVLGVSPQKFASLEKVKPDEEVSKAMDDSDEFIFKATAIKPPHFSLVK